MGCGTRWRVTNKQATMHHWALSEVYFHRDDVCRYRMEGTLIGSPQAFPKIPTYRSPRALCVYVWSFLPSCTVP